jgi:hypothetical protein
VFPTDPQSGGTWIGANDAGLVLALLNRTDTSVVVPTVTRHLLCSRGLVIPSLLGFGTLRAALKSVQTINPVLFEPFRLIMVQGREVGDATSDGRRVSIDASGLTVPMLFTSSSLGDAMVEGPRRRLFNVMIGDEESTWLEAQCAFHRHRWRRCPELSVQMERTDARTVSRSVIDVRASTVEIRYEPLERAAELVGPC